MNEHSSTTDASSAATGTLWPPFDSQYGRKPGHVSPCNTFAELQAMAPRQLLETLSLAMLGNKTYLEAGIIDSDLALQCLDFIELRGLAHAFAIVLATHASPASDQDFAEYLRSMIKHTPRIVIQVAILTCQEYAISHDTSFC